MSKRIELLKKAMIDTFKGEYDVSCREYNGFWVVSVEKYKDTVIEVTEEGIVYTQWCGYEKLKGSEKSELLIDVAKAMGKWYEVIEKKYYWKFKEAIFPTHLSSRVFNYNQANSWWFMDIGVPEFRAFFTEEEFAEICIKLNINKDFFEKVL